MTQNHDSRRDPQNLELLLFTAAIQSKKLPIGAVYRPPSADNEILEHLDANAFPK